MTSDEPASLVLDSFALLAHFRAEPGGAQVKQLFKQADAKQILLWLGVVNLAEVAYIIERERGVEDARQTVATINELPLEIVGADRTLALAAAHVKAEHAMSLADAFAVALAKHKNARVVTGDPEFESVEKEIAIEWLPRKESSSR